MSSCRLSGSLLSELPETSALWIARLRCLCFCLYRWCLRVLMLLSFSCAELRRSLTHYGFYCVGSLIGGIGVGGGQAVRHPISSTFGSPVFLLGFVHAGRLLALVKRQFVVTPLWSMDRFIGHVS